jgi:hypothetical protein
MRHREHVGLHGQCLIDVLTGASIAVLFSEARYHDERAAGGLGLAFSQGRSAGLLRVAQLFVIRKQGGSQSLE